MPEQEQVIKDSFEYGGKVHHIEYRECGSFDHLNPDEIRQVYGLCFVDGKVAVVKYEQDKPNLPGGKVESGESWETAFRREIEEELGAQVLTMQPLGYQYPIENDNPRKYELRVAAHIQLSGTKTVDPAGTVIGYELVDLEHVNDLIQYGRVGDKMVEQAAAFIESRDIDAR